MRLTKCRPALIIGAGEDVPLRVPMVFNGEQGLVICADGGAAQAKHWGLIPHAIVGDQDSLDAETKEFWSSQGVPFYLFPVAKDQTDLEIAIEFALEEGATSFVLVGAWGSRIDHSLGNLELMYRLALKDLPHILFTKNHALVAACNSFKADVRKGSIVSLLPLSPKVERLSTKGLLYPLDAVNIEKGSSLTISNIAVEEHISLDFGPGVLLVILEH